MIVVIGGGPAGFFAAIRAREARPDIPVVMLESQRAVLRKVRISGGGRCNVTHDLDDTRELSHRYPRGGRELIGPLNRFGPADTVAWFAGRGVRLKTEADGRMFPVTDDSATIIDALLNAAAESGVEVRTRCPVAEVALAGPNFQITLDGGEILTADRLLIATGGATGGGGSRGFALAAGLGHTIVEPVPSLFTLKIDDPLLAGLAGLATEATVKVGKKRLETGPVLVTHWGLSGPAVLRLSAWGARELAALDYNFILRVDWCPSLDRNQLEGLLAIWSEEHGRKQVSQRPEIGVPRRLWEALLGRLDVPRERRWSELGRKNRLRLLEALKNTELKVVGKSINKEEFVTCGGVSLREVNFKNMESKIVPGLFFAGEVLDIDGITGGFNFQGCWTTGWLAGGSLGE